ncbi:MAG: phosphatase PAP2 family protein [Anaerolineales bacterium]
MALLQELGIQLIQAIQVLMPTLDTIMEFFTFLGKIEFYMLFITFLYWIIDPSLGFRVFMVLLSTDIIATSFKQLLHQPRPYWISDVQHLGAEETSYGIPSSHASDSLAVWGYLAYQVKKGWMWVASIAIILLISFSRLYLGVHFPHDLIAGWLIGLVVLLLFAKFEKQVSTYLHKQSPSFQIGFGFVISILFIIVGIIVRLIISGTSDPESWAHYASEARSMTFYFTLAGALFGAVAGYVMMKSRASFQVKGSWTLKLGRYLIGIIGVVIAMFGLDFLFSLIASDESILGYILRYIRYGATTFWALFGAPWLFLKLKLANTS